MAQKKTDTIVLAAHLDDGVLSCGGQIYQRTQSGAGVLVATVMAGDARRGASDYAQSLRDRWQLDSSAEAVRRAEDAAACALLGADFLHWPIPDCIYRGGAAGTMYYQSDDEIFGPVHPGEAGLVADVVALLRALPAAEQIVAPLTVGNHVDHIFVRQAAEQVFGDRLFYYEDYPYAQKEGSVQGVLDRTGSGWQATVYPLSEAALRAKIAAILAYRSQFSTFWSDQTDLEQQVRGYAERVGGERVWSRGQKM
ncbi:MAG: PIG-L family deacetylase [Chloroflexi bacterium]|nr:MAG: PIG-L family deacetylase [Chloroflexota bacterium]